MRVDVDIEVTFVPALSAEPVINDVDFVATVGEDKTEIGSERVPARSGDCVVFSRRVARGRDAVAVCT